MIWWLSGLVVAIEVGGGGCWGWWSLLVKVVEVMVRVMVAMGHENLGQTMIQYLLRKGNHDMVVVVGLGGGYWGWWWVLGLVVVVSEGGGGDGEGRGGEGHDILGQNMRLFF